MANNPATNAGAGTDTGTESDKITSVAKAKINLDLLITGRRDDGYHLLDSLVVFADYGDEITVRPAQTLTLRVTGPFAAGLEGQEDNLVVKAARLLQKKFNIRQGADIHLVKNLPVSSGIGGGSADAAATIGLLLELWQISWEASSLNDLTLSLGADVPVCMVSKTRQMTGIGEILRPVSLAFPIFLLLVNSGVAVSTAGIFKARAERNISFSSARILEDEITTMAQLTAILKSTGNDLTCDACLLQPDIRNILQYIQKIDICTHVAMSGSGATCFGIFPNLESAQRQADIIRGLFPDWWAKAVRLS